MLNIRVKTLARKYLMNSFKSTETIACIWLAFSTTCFKNDCFSSDAFRCFKTWECANIYLFSMCQMHGFCASLIVLVSSSFSLSVCCCFLTIQPSTTVSLIHLLDVKMVLMHHWWQLLNTTYCIWFLCNVFGGNVLCVNLSAQFTDMLDWC